VPGSGSPGGRFTPTLTIGVLLAAITGNAWSHLWPGADQGSYALIGGAAFLAAAMQGPLSSVVLVLELTRHTDALMVPTLLAVAEATVAARLFGAPSIYSARLSAGAPVNAGAIDSRHATAQIFKAVQRPDVEAQPSEGHRLCLHDDRCGAEMTVEPIAQRAFPALRTRQFTRSSP
jgi:Voltage gated chloride channel